MISCIVLEVKRAVLCLIMGLYVKIEAQQLIKHLSLFKVCSCKKKKKKRSRAFATVSRQIFFLDIGHDS